jgi:DNA-binding transcriptional LysR family regulator
VTFHARGNLQIDHGGSLLAAVEAGLGLGQVLDFMARDALRDGRLVELLSGFATAGPGIHALATSGRARSANVRAFMQFLPDAFRA